MFEISNVLMKSLAIYLLVCYGLYHMVYMLWFLCYSFVMIICNDLFGIVYLLWFIGYGLYVTVLL